MWREGDEGGSEDNNVRKTPPCFIFIYVFWGGGGSSIFGTL